MEERITGHTELVGLIATPIRHSKSPEMHNAAFRKLGLDLAYLAFDIQEYQLEDALKYYASLMDDDKHRMIALSQITNISTLLMENFKVL